MAESLHSILDTHPDLIARLDLDYNFTYANRAIASFWGVTKSQFVQLNMMEHSSAEHQANVFAMIRQINFENPSLSSVQKFERDKNTLFIHWEIVGIFDEKDTIGYQIIGRNITRRTLLNQRLEAQTEELERTRQELRFVLDAVPSMIWYKDDENKILHLNQSAATSMGMQVKEVEGQNTYDLFGDSAKAYHEADLKVLNSGEPIRGMIEPYTPNDGEQGWVQTDKVPLANIDGSRRILVVSTDITELKEQEAILKSINKNLDDFASIVSHDLQAPLRKIAISAELMKLELAGQLPESADSYFADISDGVIRMREMIRSVLSFMRASPNGIELQPINLTPLVREIVSEELTTIKALGGRVLLPEQDIFVKGDLALLRQVFINLIQNAIKYRSRERALTIEISAKRKEQFWKIEVCDNGSGVDPAFADKVFDLFGRAKPHLGIEGSGVGLALCRRIITLHGGTISLEKKGALGSCFQVDLYRAKASEHGQGSHH